MRDLLRILARKSADVRRPARGAENFAARGGRVLGFLAIGYPVLLLGVTLALRFIGERWWVTTIALYLPRWPLALPLPLLSVALLLCRRHALLGTQLVALAIWLFPLAGLRLGMRQAATPGRPTVRALTMNIHSSMGSSSLASELRASRADVIVLQEAAGRTASWWKREFPLQEWRVDGEFVLGSRYPIAESTMPQPSAYGAQDGIRRYIRYRLLLPNTQLYVYNVHCPSPSRVFEKLRRDLESGSLGRSWRDARVDLQRNAHYRNALLEAVVADARASTYPVIIAGDTNLPYLSSTLASGFEGFQDAFPAVGSGLGYTFPVGPPGPWMRIDRIFGNESVRFLDSRVTSALSSDHLGLIVDLEL